MYGHTSPILFCVISDRHEHIYTIAFDNCVKVDETSLIEHTLPYCYRCGTLKSILA